MAHLERLKAGWRVCYRQQGKKYSLSEHAGELLSTKPRALVALAHAQDLEDADRKHRRGTVIALSEIIRRWQLAKLAGPSPNDEWSTTNSASRVRTHCEKMGWKTVADITPAEISRWRAASPAGRRQNGRAPSTAKAGVILAGVLRWSRDVLEQPVSDTVLAALRPPRARRKAKAAMLSHQQVGTALATAKAISDNAEALIHCLATYGWRAITAAKLKVSDLVGDTIACQVKGGHVVQHPLLPETLGRLEKISKGRDAGAALFLDPRTDQAWREHGKSIPFWIREQLDMASYDLKRYAISRLLDILPVHEVMQFTGHLTATQALTYARTNEERQRLSIGKMAALAVGPSGAENINEPLPQQKSTT